MPSVSIWLIVRRNPKRLKLLEEIRSVHVSDEGPLKTGELFDDVVSEADDTGDDVIPEIDETGDDLVDFATPTIAELYYSQGKLNAAISTYENVININPDDSKSLKRLIELKEVASEEPGREGKEKDALHVRTEKLIGVLEGWLHKIKKIQYA